MKHDILLILIIIVLLFRTPSVQQSTTPVQQCTPPVQHFTGEVLASPTTNQPPLFDMTNAVVLDSGEVIAINIKYDSWQNNLRANQAKFIAALAYTLNIPQSFIQISNEQSSTFGTTLLYLDFVLPPIILLSEITSYDTSPNPTFNTDPNGTYPTMMYCKIASLFSDPVKVQQYFDSIKTPSAYYACATTGDVACCEPYFSSPEVGTGCTNQTLQQALLDVGFRQGTLLFYNDQLSGNLVQSP